MYNKEQSPRNAGTVLLFLFSTLIGNKKTVPLFPHKRKNRPLVCISMLNKLFKNIFKSDKIDE